MRNLITEFTIRCFKAFENVTVKDLGRLNAFVGRNNAGKSTVLHALDLAGLALRMNDWGNFPLKVKIEDLFWDRGDFSLSLATSDGKTVTISARNRRTPAVDLGGATKEEFNSILIMPEGTYGLINRRPVSPREVYSSMEARNFSNINALDILRAIQFYARKKEKGVTQKDYDDLIEQVRSFFPELEDVVSDETDDLNATLEYKERGRTLDILYSGMGLKRFLDVLIKVTISGASIVLIDEPEYGMHPELQRRFLTFLDKLATEQHLQFFMATHSPILLNTSADLQIFRVHNQGGRRQIALVPRNLRHTIFGDLGVRPSDFFQNDICLMVEGQDDVVFFEFVLHELYKTEFAGLAVGVVQYAGDAASGITSGDLSVDNIAGAQPYVHWIRDRDARPGDPPRPASESFVRALTGAGQSATLLAKREIEFYVPMEVYVEAQGGDAAKEAIARKVCQGDQSEKLRTALHVAGCNVPRGSDLRSLLRKHLTRQNLDPEIRSLIEGNLLSWAKLLKGD